MKKSAAPRRSEVQVSRTKEKRAVGARLAGDPTRQDSAADEKERGIKL
jgi:hypothetical protein